MWRTYAERTAIAGACALAAPCAGGPMPPVTPEITTLPNGLRVITAAIPTSQAAAVAFFVGIGSRGEQPRTNGLSHYIEHMLFKGTTRRPTAPEISQAIEGAGGQLNAYTSRELTCYWNS